MSCGGFTIEAWLKGMVDYDLPDATLKSILFNNRVEEGTRVADVPEKQRDLCLACVNGKYPTSIPGEVHRFQTNLKQDFN